MVHVFFTGKSGYWSYCMLLCPFEFCYLRIPNIKVFTSSCFRKNDGFMIMNSKYNYSRWGRCRQIANNSEPLDFSKISSMSIILRHIHSYWSWFKVYHCITQEASFTTSWDGGCFVCMFLVLSSKTHPHQLSHEKKTQKNLTFHEILVV